MRVVALSLAFAAIVVAQGNPGPPATVLVSTPQARVVYGETVKLTAVARDSSGNARNNETFFWTSASEGVASVSADGTITARGLGFAEIRAAVGNIRGSVWIQVVPARIVVTPSVAKLSVGESQQFEAQVLDGGGNPIPDVSVTWDIVNAMLRTSVVASVSQNGMVRTFGAGHLYVRARYTYSGQFAMPFVPYVEETAELDVELRPSYSVSPVAATGVSAGTPGELRGRRTLLSASDSGQLFFLGGVNGTATGIMSYDSVRGLRTLAVSGSPGPVPSGLIYEFQNFAVNGRGDVLSRALVHGAAHGLLLVANDGNSRWYGSEGMYLGGIENLSGFLVTRNSLNDSGTAIVRSTYRVSGDPATYTGLFRFSPDGTVELIASTADALPGFTGPLTIENDFGIANDGTAFFRVSSGGRSAVYRQQGFNAPVRVVLTGDGVITAFQGTTYPNFFVSRAGDLVFVGTGANNQSVLVHYPPTGAHRTYAPRGIWGVFDVRNGNVLWYGDTGRGPSLQVWKTGTEVEALAAHNTPIAGAPITQIDGAAFQPTGDPAAIVRTASKPFIISRAGTTPAALIEAGARLDLSAVSMYAFVQGAESGALPMLYGGGDPANLVTIGDRGAVRPVMVYGDRFAGDVISLGMGGSTMRRSPDGDLYLFIAPFGLNVPNYGVYKTRDEKNLELVLKYNFNWLAPDGTQQFVGGINFVTENGSLLLNGGTNRSHNRLYTLIGKDLQTIATTNGNPDYLTRVTGMGVVTSWGDAVMTPAGRVMAHLRFDNNQNGVFVWQGSSWREAAVVNRTRLLDLTLTNINTIRAAGERLFASLSLSGGGTVLAEWRNDEWHALVSHRDEMPTGQPMAGILSFDVNRRGECVFLASSFGWPVMLHRDVEGKLSLVTYTHDLDQSEHQLVRFIEVDLRDDGTIWFIALDVADRYVVFQAKPQSR